MVGAAARLLIATTVVGAVACAESGPAVAPPAHVEAPIASASEARTEPTAEVAWGKADAAAAPTVDGQRADAGDRPVTFDRWRAAVEDYRGVVRVGNQTALNTSTIAFASYLSAMHNRIHPELAALVASSSGALPPDPNGYTRVEIVLDDRGRIARMGIVRSSGVTAFDVLALESVDRAQPFGAPPAAILSPDQRVYVHWELHRGGDDPCNTRGAQPFLLNVRAQP